MITWHLVQWLQQSCRDCLSCARFAQVCIKQHNLIVYCLCAACAPLPASQWNCWALQWDCAASFCPCVCPAGLSGWASGKAEEQISVNPCRCSCHLIQPLMGTAKMQFVLHIICKCYFRLSCSNGASRTVKWQICVWLCSLAGIWLGTFICGWLQFFDQGLVNSDPRFLAVPAEFLNTVPTDVRGLTFSRSPQQVDLQSLLISFD